MRCLVVGAVYFHRVVDIKVKTAGTWPLQRSNQRIACIALVDAMWNLVVAGGLQVCWPSHGSPVQRWRSFGDGWSRLASDSWRHSGQDQRWVFTSYSHSVYTVFLSKFCLQKLEELKIQDLWCSSTRRWHKILSAHLSVGLVTVVPAAAVKDLGVHLDADLTFQTHVNAVVRSSFATRRQIRSVRRSRPQLVLLTLIRSLIVSKVDYCNSLLVHRVSNYTCWNHDGHMSVHDGQVNDGHKQ